MKAHDSQPTKKTYRSPKLVVYGDIRKITQAGTSGDKNDTGLHGNDKTV
jgi:hypothetical protein